MNSTLDTDPRTAHPAQARRLSALDIGGIAALAAIIAIHTSELSAKVEETAYLGLGYVLLIATSIVAITAIAQRDIRGWLLAGLTAAATIVGYVLTRTTGLPNARDDIGNWSETIAIWSLIAESALVVLSLAAIVRTSPWKA